MLASFENLEKMAQYLTLLGAKKVVITGIPEGNKIWNFVYNGEELYEAVLKAVHFINKVIKFMEKLNIPLNYGLGFKNI